MKLALLVIDVQNEYFTGKLPITYPEGSFENILKIMDKCKENKIKIITVQHFSPAQNSITFIKHSNKWELHPKIKEKHSDKLIEKCLPGSFTNTDLEDFLRKNEIDTIAIVGYMTHMCCDTTARQAFHLGFNVIFLKDATGTLSFSNESGSISAEDLHRAILITQSAKFSKVMSTEDFINSINNNFR